jgi:hypothetical protein
MIPALVGLGGRWVPAAPAGSCTASPDSPADLSDVQRVDLHPDRLVSLPGTEHTDGAA